MKKVYFAHCLALYNTPQEARDIQTLEKMGFEVINPNTPECQQGYKEHGMGYFKQFSTSCDLVAFRALPDGSIPSGIASEVEWFVLECKPVIELPSAWTRRCLTVTQTQAYLHEVGQR